MQLLSMLVPDWLLFVLIGGFLILLYYYRETLYTHYKVRYEFPGGIEELHPARLSGTNVVWKRKGKIYETGVKTKSRQYTKMGVKYDILTVHYANEQETTNVVDPTYPDPYDDLLHISSVASMESDIKEGNMVKQLVQGMHSLNLMDRIVMLALGLFMGFPVWMWVLGYLTVGGG